ncbi:hypothetical protein BN8_01695 [Fibrisoma limi BUZ 3]|uniref:Uncharacterized protein n=2 Tax=Fibrisoma limi TaxID=663275 RepID=I2GFK3_9BACT|nr:hypothetical protein BN8_01695 [Fibrisoma limi BUZ 3]
MAGALLWFFAELLFISLGLSTGPPDRRPVVVEVGSAITLMIPQLCYLIGLPALYEVGAISRKWPVRFAQAAIVVYTLPFLAAMLMKSGVSGAGRNPVLFLLPLGLVLIAISMTIVGLAVRKTRVWTDWRQYTPFAVGWFPVGLMLPLAAIYGKPDYMLVAVWGLTWFLLGLAIYKSGQRTSREAMIVSSQS